jgi:predicted RNA-binding protein with PUA-like domain
MNYWLLKSDPDCYNFAALEAERRAVWDGVTNAQAQQFIRQMRKGDRALIYHTGKEKSIVGLADVASDPYRDPADKAGKLSVVDLRAGPRVRLPVTLSAIKSEQAFKDFLLVRHSRLSVMPVPPPIWEALRARGGW